MLAFEQVREVPSSVAARRLETPGHTGAVVDDDWTREAIRLHDRYTLEIVEHYGLCPWATRARVGKRLRTVVCLQADADSVEDSVGVLYRWQRDEGMEVGFLLYPRLALARAEFERFVTAVRTADSEQHPLGSAPFAMVGFHPDATPVLDDPERLIPFLRRTPDPCIQVVRIDVLERVRGSVPEGTQFVDVAFLEQAATKPVEVSVRDRVGRANLETVRGAGADEVRQRMEAIRQDRDATYAKLRGAP
jgi:hypothetical protein